MKSVILSLIIILYCSVGYCQQWNNPENQMLSDSISSFFYYSTNNPSGFSDPRSLRDTEFRSIISDNYHQESEQILERIRQDVKIKELQSYRQHNFRYNIYKK